MTITVYYLAQLRRATKLSIEAVKLEASDTLGDLLARIVQVHGDELRRLLLDDQGSLRSTLLVFLNDEQAVDPERVFLKDGDSITFLSPIAGG